MTDHFAYNGEPGHTGRSFDPTGASGEVFVPDLEIACHVTRAAGSGVWGFLWEYRAERLTASIGADGTVTLAHSGGESGQGDTASKDQASAQGRLVSARRPVVRSVSPSATDRPI